MFENNNNKIAGLYMSLATRKAIDIIHATLFLHGSHEFLHFSCRGDMLRGVNLGNKLSKTIVLVKKFLLSKQKIDFHHLITSFPVIKGNLFA